MTIRIRIDIAATVRGANLFGDLNVEFIDAAKRLLRIDGYSIHKLGTGFECYLIKNHNNATPIDPIDYVHDRLDTIHDWLVNSKYPDLFKIERLIIDVDDNRFQYKTQSVGSGEFEWVSY